MKLYKTLLIALALPALATFSFAGTCGGCGDGGSKEKASQESVISLGAGCGGCSGGDKDKA